MTEQEFQRLDRACRSVFGLFLNDSKRSMVGRRLGELTRRLNRRSTGDLIDDFVRGDDPNLVSAVVDALTTNHTFFLREPVHFEHFQNVVLPEFESRLQQTCDLRVWCAAASTGEEPYYIAMLLRDYFGLRYPEWEAGVLATDISNAVLQVAMDGCYESNNAERLPNSVREKYLRSTVTGYEIHPDIRSDVTFRRFNLIAPDYPFRQPFHVIFCRNVLIYFDETQVDSVVANLARSLVPGGYLYIGVAESIRSRCDELEFVQTGVYRRRMG
ncbi:MAG: protein-glutamate O-methyltransferase CheR [Myxococcota bacterium]